MGAGGGLGTLPASDNCRPCRTLAGAMSRTVLAPLPAGTEPTAAGRRRVAAPAPAAARSPARTPSLGAAAPRPSRLGLVRRLDRLHLRLPAREARRGRAATPPGRGAGRRRAAARRRGQGAGPDNPGAGDPASGPHRAARGDRPRRCAPRGRRRRHRRLGEAAGGRGGSARRARAGAGGRVERQRQGEPRRRGADPRGQPREPGDGQPPRARPRRARPSRARRRARPTPRPTASRRRLT